MINVRMQEALEYKHSKEEREKVRLREVTLQVKTANDKELDDFMQYLKYEYDQTHVQKREKNQPVISMEDYVQAASSPSQVQNMIRSPNRSSQRRSKSRLATSQHPIHGYRHRRGATPHQTRKTQYRQQVEQAKTQQETSMRPRK